MSLPIGLRLLRGFTLYLLPLRQGFSSANNPDPYHEVNLFRKWIWLTRLRWIYMTVYFLIKQLHNPQPVTAITQRSHAFWSVVWKGGQNGSLVTNVLRWQFNVKYVWANSWFMFEQHCLVCLFFYLHWYNQSEQWNMWNVTFQIGSNESPLSVIMSILLHIR